MDKLKKSTTKDLAVVVGIMQDQIAKVDAPAQVTYESLNIALNQAITIINANREKMKAFRKEYELNP